MTIKVLVLKSGEDVIADVQEMMSSSEQVMGYFLTKPCVVKIQEMYEKQVLDDGKETDSTTDSNKQSETNNSD